MSKTLTAQERKQIEQQTEELADSEYKRSTLDNAKALVKGSIEGKPRMKAMLSKVQTENVALQVELGLLTLPLYPNDWTKGDPVAQWQKSLKADAKRKTKSGFRQVDDSPAAVTNPSLQAVRWIVAKPPVANKISCPGAAALQRGEDWQQ